MPSVRGSCNGSRCADASMRLLVDAQLPPTLTQSFVSKGHDAVHVAVCDESLPSRALKLDFLRMATIAEVEKLALDLPETERAVLAAHLLGSLPSVLHDEDEGGSASRCGV